LNGEKNVTFRRNLPLRTEKKEQTFSWSQPYDFGIDNYNASAVCSRLERFSNGKKKFGFIAQLASRGVVKIYNAGVVTRSRGSKC
jgi:hypothetical protein